MISKKFRLTEKQVKRVLHKWKPFFSYWIVVNYWKNKIWYNRFSIVIWAKSVNNNVERNFFRRRFYNLIKNNINCDFWYDFVFVVKKLTKLDKKDKKSIFSFDNDIKFLLNKLKEWKKS